MEREVRSLKRKVDDIERREERRWKKEKEEERERVEKENGDTDPRRTSEKISGTTPVQVISLPGHGLYTPPDIYIYTHTFDFHFIILQRFSVIYPHSET